MGQSAAPFVGPELAAVVHHSGRYRHSCCQHLLQVGCAHADLHSCHRVRLFVHLLVHDWHLGRHICSHVCFMKQGTLVGRVSQRQISCASFCRCLRILVTVYRVTMYCMYNVVGVHASSSRVDSRLTAGPVCAGDFVRKRTNIAKIFFAGLCPAPRQGCCPGPA